MDPDKSKYQLSNELIDQLKKTRPKKQLKVLKKAALQIGKEQLETHANVLDCLAFDSETLAQGILNSSDITDRQKSVLYNAIIEFTDGLSLEFETISGIQAQIKQQIKNLAQVFINYLIHDGETELSAKEDTAYILTSYAYNAFSNIDEARALLGLPSLTLAKEQKAKTEIEKPKIPTAQELLASNQVQGTVSIYYQTPHKKSTIFFQVAPGQETLTAQIQSKIEGAKAELVKITGINICAPGQMSHQGISLPHIDLLPEPDNNLQKITRQLDTETLFSEVQSGEIILTLKNNQTLFLKIPNQNCLYQALETTSVAGLLAQTQQVEVELELIQKECQSYQDQPWSQINLAKIFEESATAQNALQTLKNLALEQNPDLDLSQVKSAQFLKRQTVFKTEKIQKTIKL